MSFFSAFARGAAGRGLINLSQSMRQREAEAARAAEAEREREFRAKERELDREAQAAALRERLAGGGSRARSAGGGAGGDDGGGYDDIVVGGLMQQEGMSQAEAAAAFDASRRGENIFKKASGRKVASGRTIQADGEAVDNQVDEMVDEMVPDVDRWMAINRKIGEMLTRSRSIAKSNDEQLAGAERTRWGTAAGQAAESFPQAAPALNRGQQVAEGKFSPEREAAEIEADRALAEQRRRVKPDFSDRRLSLQEIESERKRLKDAVAIAQKTLDSARRETRADAQRRLDEALADLDDFNRQHRSGGAAPAGGPTSAPSIIRRYDKNGQLIKG